MNNIITAIPEIANFRQNDLRVYATKYLNRINAVGEQLEFYIKDALAGSFNKPYAQKDAEHRKVFSYLGNQNHPPDIILSGGDAFEIKKMEGLRSALHLNSSYPKDKLYASDPRITAWCRQCDGGKWATKDLFYVVGYIRSGLIKHLFFVHGSCYAAEKSIYKKLHNPLKTEITRTIRTQGLQGSPTVELGKVKRVDPLGITNLRIRGMWDIQNPVKVFDYAYLANQSKNFSLCAILTADKFNSFPEKDRILLRKLATVSIAGIMIKDPNNPARSIPAKLITLNW